MADVKHYGISGISSDVELGEGGPRILVNSGNVEFRDPAGTNLVKVVGLAGSGADDFVTFTQLGTKQDTLVSGANIKTINGNTLLGSGDIAVGTGTVTSVTVNGTTNQITSSGSPITSSGTITVALANNPELPGSEGMTFPSGTTAQRSAAPLAGEARYNMTQGDFEAYLASTWLPFGRILDFVYTDVPQGSVTGQIPFDNTTPQVTEGTLIATMTLTPKLATSKVILYLGFMTDSSSSNRNCILTFFNGSTFLGATAVNIATAGRPQTLSLMKVFTPGVTTPITLTARLGSANTGTTTYISRAGGATFGGTNPVQFMALEVK